MQSPHSASRCCSVLGGVHENRNRTGRVASNETKDTSPAPAAEADPRSDYLCADIPNLIRLWIIPRLPIWATSPRTDGKTKKYSVAEQIIGDAFVSRGRQVIQEAMDKNKAFLNLINDIISSSPPTCIVFYLLRVPGQVCICACLCITVIVFVVGRIKCSLQINRNKDPNQNKSFASNCDFEGNKNEHNKVKVGGWLCKDFRT